MKKILFVCTGNTCRSVISEYLAMKYLKEANADDKFEVLSCGIGASPHFKIPDIVINLLKCDGINEINHTPTQINKKIIDESSLILVMDKTQRNFIYEFYPKAIEKTFLLKEYIGEGDEEIYDPIGLPENEYIKKYNEIKNCIIKLVNKLICEGAL